MANQNEIDDAEKRLRTINGIAEANNWKHICKIYPDDFMRLGDEGVQEAISNDRYIVSQAYLAERDGVKAMVEALERIGSNWAENPRDEADTALAKYKATGGHDKKQAKGTDDER